MSRSGGYKCYNIRCGSCIGKTLCGEPADAALGCENRIVSKETNADRIRAMQDEELADIFLKADFCKLCDYNKNGVCDYIWSYPNIPFYEGCKQAAVKWMKHPAEED